MTPGGVPTAPEKTDLRAESNKPGGSDGRHRCGLALCGSAQAHVKWFAPYIVGAACATLPDDHGSLVLDRDRSRPGPLNGNPGDRTLRQGQSSRQTWRSIRHHPLDFTAIGRRPVCLLFRADENTLNVSHGSNAEWQLFARSPRKRKGRFRPASDFQRPSTTTD